MFYRRCKAGRVKAWHVFFTVAVMIVVGSLFGQPILSDTSTGKLSIRSLSYRFDPQGALTIDQQFAASNEFTVAEERELNFGFDKRPLWVHLEIENQTTRFRHAILEIDFPPLDDIQFFDTDGHRVIRRYVSGDMHPVSTRPVFYRNHAFPLSIAANSTKDVYLRVETTSILSVNPQIYTESEFRSGSNTLNLLLGGFYGMVLIMAAYSLGQFLILHDRIFIVYAVYVLALGGFLFIYNGLGFVYLFPDSPYLANLLNPVFLGFLIFSGLLFSSEYLQLYRTQRLFWYIHVGLAGLAILAVMGASFISYQSISLPLNLLLLVVLTVLSVVTMKGVIEKSLMAWFYLLSFSGFFVSGFIVVLGNLGFFKQSVNIIYWIQIAAAFEMVILALGVSYRYRKLRQEREELQKRNQTSIKKLTELNNELDMARQIQLTLLPDIPPTVAGLRIVSEYEPTGKLGGDYFDFFHDDHEVGILIADVTGHGTPAALFASLVRYTFQTYRPFMRDPSGLFEWMNRTIHGRTGDYFLTAGYLYINSGQQIMRYGSSGHPPLLHLKRNGTVIKHKGRGPAMGVIEQIRPETVTADLEKGDWLFLYTDGLEEVIEACAQSDKIHIPAELDTFFELYSDKSLDEFIEDLRSLIISNRTGPFAIEDDVTWIVVEVQ